MCAGCQFRFAGGDSEFKLWRAFGPLLGWEGFGPFDDVGVIKGGRWG